MKTSYQTLLKALLLGVFLLGSEAFATDQEWMVKITTKTNAGEVITGTGYLVKVGKKTYVRTASHVTLGTENVELTTGSGVPLTINSGKGLSHNGNDDQFISINQSDLEVLGTYNKRSKSFRVDPKVYKTAVNSKLKKTVESGEEPAFYLVPSWTRGQAGEFENKSPTLLNKGLVDSKRRSKLSLSQSEKVGIVDTKIIPGESGSALIKMDAKGNAYIFGHAQSYQRNFDHSSFSSPKGAVEMVTSLENGKTGQADDTKWKRKNGVFYRENQEAREANFLSLVAGDGVIAGGGDGVIAGGGDGVIAGGGDGVIAGGGDSKTKIELPTFGMTYKGKMTYAFKVSEVDRHGRYSNKYIYANWDNYTYIKELKKKNSNLSVKAITDEDLMGMIIAERSFKNDREDAKRCSIEQSSLLDGILTVTLPGFKTIRLDISGKNAVRDFSPIQKLKRSSNDTGDWTVDLRGLFATDISDSSEEIASSFITLRHPQLNHVKVKCALEFSEDKAFGTGKISTSPRSKIKKLLSIIGNDAHHTLTTSK